jgi:transposase
MTQRNGNREKVRELTEQKLSAKVIAKRLGIAVSTVYVHQHKLREQGRLPDNDRP